MALIHDIRKQPIHIRKVMFGLSVITAISFVGVLWFNSFQHNMYALLNPAPTDSDAPQYAQKDQTRSPFAVIYDSVKDTAANIFGFFQTEPRPVIQRMPQPSASERAYQFPDSGAR